MHEYRLIYKKAIQPYSHTAAYEIFSKAAIRHIFMLHQTINVIYLFFQNTNNLVIMKY